MGRLLKFSPSASPPQTSMSAPHPVATLVQLLRSIPEVATAVGSVELHGQRVPFILGGEIEGEALELMPRKCVLITENGGSRDASPTPLFKANLDIRCFGVDPGGAFEASELSLAVHSAIQSRGRTRVNSTLILSITQIAGPIPNRETYSRWPFNLRTYEVLISEE